MAATTVMLCVAGGPAAFADSTTTTVSSAAATTTTTTTTTTVPPTTTTTLSPVWKAPLTGLPDPSELTRHRSALTIKMDNTPAAHPQFGLQEADVVYEEVVEGQITRLAAIFNSHLPTEVGPVRSVRRTDRQIVFPIGGLFAFSGGAQYAVSSIETAPVKLLQESDAGGAMFRDLRRPPPHNLLANAALLMKFNGVPKPPPALFTYRSASTPATGARVNAFYVDFASGYETGLHLGPERPSPGTVQSLARPTSPRPVSASHPANVIVMNVLYRGGVGVEGAYAQLTGSGYRRGVQRGSGPARHVDAQQTSPSPRSTKTPPVRSSHSPLDRPGSNSLTPSERAFITAQPTS